MAAGFQRKVTEGVYIGSLKIKGNSMKMDMKQNEYGVFIDGGVYCCEILYRKTLLFLLLSEVAYT